MRMAQLLCARLARLVRDENAFWSATSLGVGFLALMKGIRLPNLWAATQAQVDYRFGFVKRGLFGTVVARPLHLHAYWRFAAFSTVMLLALLTALAIFAVSSGMRRRFRPAVLLAVFSSSYAVTYLGNMNGYFDILLALTAVALVSIRRPLLRLAFGLVLIPAALLVHESFLVIFLPVVLLPFLLEWEAGKRVGMVAIILLGTLAIGVTARLALRRPLDSRQIAMEQSAIKSQVDFAERKDFFDVFDRSTKDNLRLMWSYTHRLFWWVRLASCAIVVAPMIGMYLWIIRGLMRGNGTSLWAIIGVGVAALAPILMNAVAWDIGRWFALAQVTTYLSLGVVCLHTRGAPIEFTPAMKRLGVAVIFLNLASGEYFLELEDIHGFPYTYVFHRVEKPAQ